ncbi:MAG TPA: hypothetical protein VFG14_05610 [Chthoniobacteraceae bacterium]|nr:hypothetical protein [Chthoniobacteraceae bacterium]
MHFLTERVSESWLRLLLRILGWICVLALIPLFMPWSWLDVGHRLLALGDFPAAPIAEYLARSVSALCAFYGGLLLLLARDVRRFLSIIRYQAVAIMTFSVIGIFAGTRAGVPAFIVIADALGCWAFLLPILILAARLNREGP